MKFKKNLTTIFEMIQRYNVMRLPKNNLKRKWQMKLPDY